MSKELEHMKEQKEAPLLPASRESAGAPDTRIDPQSPHPSPLYSWRNAGELSDLPGGANRRPGDGAAENLIPSAGGCAGSGKDDSRFARSPERSNPIVIGRIIRDIQLSEEIFK